MDWKKIIAEIRSAGQLTQPQIANQCGCGQATISGLSIGTTRQPRHSLGVALLALHSSVTNKEIA